MYLRFSKSYRFVAAIINVTAITEILIPNMMFVVSGSPNTIVPTSIAVIGSNTPSTDALVAPILRVAMARVAVDTMVGNKASPMRLSQLWLVDMPAVIGVWARMICAKNTIDPTIRV